MAPTSSAGGSHFLRAGCVCVRPASARVSSHLRMCMLDRAGRARLHKRRCFQSDRASSTHRLFRRRTFLLNVSLLGATRTLPTALTSARSLQQPLAVRFYGCGRDFGAAQAGLRRRCGCCCPGVKRGEDLNHISRLSRVMLCGDKGQSSTRMTRLSLPLR